MPLTFTSGARTFSITTFSIMDFSVTLGISIKCIMLSVAFSYGYAKCHYASVVMLNVIMLNVVTPMTKPNWLEPRNGAFPFFLNICG